VAEVHQSGAARIEVDQAELLRRLDQVSDGAGTRFVQRASRVLGGLQADAVSRWPVRTGTSRGAFRVQSRITESAATVDLANTARSGRWGAYAFKIRWSVRTQASLEAEADRAADRAKDPGGAAAIRAFWRRRLTRTHGKGAPSAALAGKQPWRVLVRTPGQKAAQAMIGDLREDLDRLARGA